MQGCLSLSSNTMSMRLADSKQYFEVTDCKFDDPRPVAECPVTMKNNRSCQCVVPYGQYFGDVTFVCVEEGAVS